MITGEIYDDYR